jgi:glycine cleavage system H protein
MSFPEGLKYTKDHEWIEATAKPAKIGVTAYAVEQLGDIVHVDLPNVGESFEAGAAFGTIESTKTVSDLYMPIAGKVVAVNTDATTKPESLQEDP